MGGPSNHSLRGWQRSYINRIWSGKITILFATLPSILGAYAAKNVVENFLIDNGHHHVDMFFNHSTNDYIQLMPKNIHLARIHISEIKASKSRCFGVFYFDSEF